MQAVIAWLLAAAALAGGYLSYGWPGVMLAVTCIVFWLLLQFNRTLRVMRRAGERPVGTVDNAVMLHARLRVGMPLLAIVGMTRSLGRPLEDASMAQDAPGDEAYQWRDGAGDRVVVHCARGRCTRWELLRQARPAESTADPAVD